MNTPAAEEGRAAAVMSITGRTRLYGIIADPVAQVKTPEAFNRLMAENGIDAVMVPFHVPPEGLAGLLAGLRRTRNFGGCIVTVPHKEPALPLCDRVDDEAARVGAVNCLRREPDGQIKGAMLDGIGFVTGLRGAGINPRGMRAYVAGAGGAASAVAFALAAAGVAALTVANRTEARARALCDRLAAHYPGLPLSIDPAGLGSCDLVMNATALGMRPDDPLPLDIAALHPGHIVAEAVMEPAMTPLLMAATRAGCRIHPGLPMLESQIRLMAQHMGALPAVPAGAAAAG